MNAAAYKPRAGSVAWQVIEFLTANPGESLTAEDVAVKFDVSSPSAVHSSLGAAVLAGVLMRTTLESGELVYWAGDGVPAIEPRPAPDAVGMAIAGPLPRRRGDGYLDTADIEIDKGVPLAPRCGPRQTDWAGLLRRMEPGDSCALPLRVRSSVSKVINAEKVAQRGQYRVRKINAQTIRLWRTQ